MSAQIVTCPPDRFGELLSVAEAVFAENVSTEMVAQVERVADKERFLVALDGGTIVATAGVFTFRMTVPGGELPTGGVTWVAVLPTHRRQGLMSAMMRRMIDDCHERGEPLAALWASEGSIYQRFGYGLATWSLSLDAEVRSSGFVRDWPSEGSFRLVTPDEALGIVVPVYEAARSQRAGFLGRSPVWWAGVLPHPDKDRRGGEAKHLVAYVTPDGPEAYAVYSVRASWNEIGAGSTLTVHEAIGATERGSREIWRWLLDVDLVRTLHASRLPPDHPLPFLVGEPRRLGMKVGDGLWLRVVDAATALEGRTYPADGRLVLGLRDDYCPWNGGCWTLDVSGGACRVTRGAADPDLALDANDLGAILLGGNTPSALAAAGRMVASRPAALALADALFPTALSPWCPEEF